MGCCGGSTGTTGMGGGMTRWIMPVLFAVALAQSDGHTNRSPGDLAGKPSLAAVKSESRSSR